MERASEAIDCCGGLCSGRIGLRGRPASGCYPGQIYRWRQEVRTVAPGFAEVVVAPGPDEGSAAGVPALEIELGPVNFSSVRAPHSALFAFG